MNQPTAKQVKAMFAATDESASLERERQYQSKNMNKDDPPSEESMAARQAFINGIFYGTD